MGRLSMWPNSDQSMVFHSFVMADHELCGVVDAPAALKMVRALIELTCSWNS